MTATKTKKTLKMEGSVRQRENGSWEYRIFIGKDINGKLKYKSIYAKTEKELKAKIKDYNDNQVKFIERVYTTTFSEYAKFWMKTYKLPNLKPVSYDRLEQTYDKVCTYFGHVQMGNIDSSPSHLSCPELLLNQYYPSEHDRNKYKLYHMSVLNGHMTLV